MVAGVLRLAGRCRECLGRNVGGQGRPPDQVKEGVMWLLKEKCSSSGAAKAKAWKGWLVWREGK